jgi:hypothetical protein
MSGVNEYMAEADMLALAQVTSTGLCLNPVNPRLQVYCQTKQRGIG